MSQGILSDIVGDWQCLVAEWYLGNPPAHTEAQIKTGLRTVDELWPSVTQHLFTATARGALAIVPVIELGLILSSTQLLAGFSEVFHRLQHGEKSAFSELVIADALLRMGYSPVLEPTLKRKRLDAVVETSDGPVYVEVIAPESSNATRECHRQMHAIIDRLLSSMSDVAVEIMVEPDASEEKIASWVQVIAHMPTDGMVREIASSVFAWKGQVDTQMSAPRNIPRPAGTPILAQASARTKDGRATVVSAWMPVADERAKRLLAGEIEHFSREEMNLLIVDMTDVQAAGEWGTAFRACLTPSQNTRIGAIATHSRVRPIPDCTTKQRWRIQPNLHARRPLPHAFLDKLAALDQPL